jgi:hypothetical protein
MFDIFFIITFFLFAGAIILFLTVPRLDKITWYLLLGWVITSCIAGYFYFNKWWGVLVALFIDIVLAGAGIVTALESNIRMEKLALLLDEPDIKLRLQAVRAIKPTMVKEGGIALLCRALENDNEEVRFEAAKALTIPKYAQTELAALKQAQNDPSEKVREAAKVSFEELGGELASKEWFEEVARLKDRKSQGKSSVISLFAPPLPGLGSKILTVAIGSVLTGSPNVGALAADSSRADTGDAIKLPEICCLCNINTAEKVAVTSAEVTASKVGMALGGTIMGKQKVDFSVPLCKLCANLVELSPGVELLDYKKIKEKWQIKLSFLNEKALDRFKELNKDRLVES